jgi:hypothetical protein
VERRIAFEDEVADEHTLCAALGRCAERIGRALRAQREYCRSLTLTLVMADGSRVQQGERLAAPLDEAGDLCRAAIRLFRRVTIDKPLLEVCLDASELGFGSGTQLTLLDEFGNNLPGQRQCRLDTAVAFIRKRFGVGAIVTAGRMRKARRVRLWTYSLGHLMDEAVEVVTDAEGIPVRYWRRGRRYRYEVKSVQNRWREAEWFWDTLSERTIYRVETDPPGLAELYRIGDHWRLGAVAD